MGMRASVVKTKLGFPFPWIPPFGGMTPFLMGMRRFLMGMRASVRVEELKKNVSLPRRRESRVVKTKLGFPFPWIPPFGGMTPFLMGVRRFLMGKRASVRVEELKKNVSLPRRRESRVVKTELGFPVPWIPPFLLRQEATQDLAQTLRSPKDEAWVGGMTFFLIAMGFREAQQ